MCRRKVAQRGLVLVILHQIGIQSSGLLWFTSPSRHILSAKIEPGIKSISDYHWSSDVTSTNVRSWLVRTAVNPNARASGLPYKYCVSAILSHLSRVLTQFVTECVCAFSLSVFDTEAKVDFWTGSYCFSGENIVHRQHACDKARWAYSPWIILPVWRASVSFSANPFCIQYMLLSGYCSITVCLLHKLDRRVISRRCCRLSR